MDRSHEASFEHSGQTFGVHDNDGRAKEFDESAQTHEKSKAARNRTCPTHEQHHPSIEKWRRKVFA